MLLVRCPNCGERSELEFRCGGQAHIQRPSASGTEVSDQAWAEYLFYRVNPKGQHRERWLHTAGCGRWFNIIRDTVTHQIIAIYPMGAAGPDQEIGIAN